MSLLEIRTRSPSVSENVSDMQNIYENIKSFCGIRHSPPVLLHTVQQDNEDNSR